MPSLAPKGRMGDMVLKLFPEIRLWRAGPGEDSRKLVVVPGRPGALSLVKPSDGDLPWSAARRHRRGGKDTLMETEPDVYELLDLKFGKCVVAVAAKNGWVEGRALPLRVATKYVNIAQNYYLSLNRQIDIIKLNGSIELAPILGLSDVIVDIRNRYHAQGKRFERVQRSRLERAPDRKPRELPVPRALIDEIKAKLRQSYDSHFAQP